MCLCVWQLLCYPPGAIREDEEGTALVTRTEHEEQLTGHLQQPGQFYYTPPPKSFFFFSFGGINALYSRLRPAVARRKQNFGSVPTRAITGQEQEEEEKESK